MKKNTFAVALSVALFAGVAANAAEDVKASKKVATPQSSQMSVRPYVGVEYGYMGTNKSKFVANKYSEFTPKVGARFGQFFGVEAGYMRSLNSNKKLPTTGDFAGSKGKTRSYVDGAHVDANFYAPLTREVEAIGSVGLGKYSVHTKTKGKLVKKGQEVKAKAIKNKNNIAYRLGLGLQYNVSKNVSLQGMVRYVNMRTHDYDVKKSGRGTWLGTVGVNYNF